MYKSYKKDLLLSTIEIPHLHSQFKRLAEMSAATPNAVLSGKHFFYRVSDAFCLANANGLLSKTSNRRLCCFDIEVESREKQRIFMVYSSEMATGFSPWNYRFKDWVQESDLPALGFSVIPKSPFSIQHDISGLLHNIRCVELASFHVLQDHQERLPADIDSASLISAIERTLACRPSLVKQIHVFHGNLQFAIPVFLTKGARTADCYAIGVYDQATRVMTIVTKLSPKMMEARLILSKQTHKFS